MQPPTIERISPAYIGEMRIGLTATPTAPTAYEPVTISVDYSRCSPTGIVLPLELLIQAPTSTNVVRRYFRRSAPDSFSFTPSEGGRWGVLLREVAHNRWKGALSLDVAGEPDTA